MADVTRRKVSISTSISPKIGSWFDAEMASGEYSSQSDLLQIALTEYFTREEIRNYQDKLIKIYFKLLEDEAGRKLLNEMPRDRATQIDALKKRGMACVELGDLDEAMSCFSKAKELENTIKDNKVPEAIVQKTIFD